MKRTAIARCNGNPPDESALPSDTLRGRTLMNALLEHAARELGARRNFVSAQAESVVAHAIARELADRTAAYQKFATDEQLYGRLHLAVTHRIKELLRSRKENARHLEQASGRGADDRPGLDPAAQGAGPSTFVARREHRSRLDTLNEESRARLLGATPAADRALVEALFVERVDLELLLSPAEEARGETAVVLAQRVSELIRASLVESLGDEGVVYLMRLLGKPKRG